MTHVMSSSGLDPWPTDEIKSGAARLFKCCIWIVWQGTFKTLTNIKTTAIGSIKKARVNKIARRL